MPTTPPDGGEGGGVGAGGGAGAGGAGRRPLLLAAAVALLDADGRALVQRRGSGPTAGLWEFPGGKALPGETPEETAAREVEEELGLRLEGACLAPLTFASHAYPSFHLLMPLFVCRRWSGLPAPLEGQALHWSTAAGLARLEMPAANAPLAAALRAWV